MVQLYEKGDWTPLPAMKTGLGRLCPRCGQSGLFRAYLKLHTECPSCGLDFEPFDQGDGPAFFVMFIVGAIVTPIALIFHGSLGLPFWGFISVIAVLTLILSLALLPPAKGLLVALQFKHDAGDVVFSEFQGREEKGEDE